MTTGTIVSMQDVPQRFKPPQTRRREAKRKLPGPDKRETQSSGDFNSKHPRDASGRFGSGGGGAAKPAPPKEKSHLKPPPDKKGLRGKKIMLLARRLKRVKDLEADHTKRFGKFLEKLPVSKAGMSPSAAEALVWRARSMDDAGLSREQAMYKKQADAARKNGNYNLGHQLDAQAATMQYLLNNREAIRATPKAERRVAAAATVSRVGAWNALPAKERVKLARKTEHYPGKEAGFVISSDGKIHADTKGFKVPPKPKPRKKPKKKEESKATKPKGKKPTPDQATTVAFKLPTQNKA